MINMSELICPRTGQPCPMTELCEAVNAPLVNAISRIRTEVPPGPGKGYNYVATALTRELTSLGNVLVADFSPKIYGNDAVICPGQVLTREAPAGPVPVSKSPVVEGLAR